MLTIPNHGLPNNGERSSAKRETSIKDRAQFWILVFSFVLGLATFGWGVYVFVYQNVYIVGNLPPTLNVTNEISNVGSNGSLVALSDTITFNNTSQTRVYLLASWLEVVGATIKAKPGPQTDDVYYFKFQKSVLPTPRTISIPRNWKETNDAIVDVCHIFLNGQWFEPGEIQKRTLIIYVPKSTYNLVRFKAIGLMSKDRHGNDDIELLQGHGGILTPFIRQDGSTGELSVGSSDIEADSFQVTNVSEYSLWPIRNE